LAGFIIAAVTSAVITLGLMIAAEKSFNLALFTKIAMIFPQKNRLLGFLSTKIKMTSA
jgi:hypothetical protein